MTSARSKFVYLNGRIVPGARAAVSVFDRGLLYGDGLFDTVRVYRGVPFAWREHMKRLTMSAGFLGIRVPRAAWQTDIATLLHRNRLTDTDAWLRITVTRGVGVPGLVPSARMTPTVIMTCGAVDPSLAHLQEAGVTVALLPFARHGFLAEHKVLNYLPAVLGKTIALRHHAFEGLYVNDDGQITEGTTTNLFVWRRRRLVTPPTVGALPGITRQVVMHAAAAAGIDVRERPVTAQDLRDADEAYLTSSIAEVVPIVGVDTQPVGDGEVGQHTRRMQALYRQCVERARRRRPAR